jgi:hypothetical protein
MVRPCREAQHHRTLLEIQPLKRQPPELRPPALDDARLLGTVGVVEQDAGTGQGSRMRPIRS